VHGEVVAVADGPSEHVGLVTSEGAAGYGHVLVVYYGPTVFGTVTVEDGVGDGGVTTVDKGSTGLGIVIGEH